VLVLTQAIDALSRDSVESDLAAVKVTTGWYISALWGGSEMGNTLAEQLLAG
jgi:hypothetical protein